MTTRRWLGVLALVGLLATVVFCRVAVADVLQVSSESMEPTLSAGDRVLVRKIGLSSVRRGDLVTFASPQDERLALKRVIGVAGDRIEISDGELSVNGRPVDEPYLAPGVADLEFLGPLLVGRGRIFVMGDNRERSTDSRAYGAVAESRIRGVVIIAL